MKGKKKDSITKGRCEISDILRSSLRAFIYSFLSLSLLIFCRVKKDKGKYVRGEAIFGQTRTECHRPHLNSVVSGAILRVGIGNIKRERGA